MTESSLSSFISPDAVSQMAPADTDAAQELVRYC